MDTKFDGYTADMFVPAEVAINCEWCGRIKTTSDMMKLNEELVDMPKHFMCKECYIKMAHQEYKFIKGEGENE